MEGFVKAVFLGILGTTVALILYFILFGFSGSSNWSFSQGSANSTQGHEILNTDTTGWKGVLFYAAEAIEVPISAYYYKYCLNVATEDYAYLDRIMGYDVDTTITDLSGSNDIFHRSFDGSKASDSSAVSRYSTDWK